ncbi:MAG: M20/M25/M40 family metallo-hydrolase [Prevotellaceae bacterium]|jgi:hypothetical protein|nr:M20/M25/M40 family metallo-hydrolase [Prevotellaceae bacterium]
MRIRKIFNPILFAAALFCAACVISRGFARDQIAEQPSASLDSLRMRSFLVTLASDDFRGRGTGDIGGEMAQRYIADQLKRLGVLPVNGTSYFQNIDVEKSVTGARRCFTANGLAFDDDYLYLNSRSQDSILHFTELTFIPFGNDSLDLKGKAVIKPMSKQPDAVSDELAPLISIDIFAPEEPLPFAPRQEEELLFASDRFDGLFPARLPDTPSAYNYVRINYASAERLLRSLGESLGALVESETTKTFKLSDTAEIHGNIVYRRLNACNVAGMVEGSDLKNEYVILLAHHDHLGTIDGRVYNGADDNASGVACLMEIAAMLAEAKRTGQGTRRSVVVLFPAAEEHGLFGSRYYVEHPLVPLDATKACINLDMMGRIDFRYENKTKDYIFAIHNKAWMGDLIERTEKLNSDKLILDYTDDGNYFYRSDHYCFAMKNIPSIFFTSGNHADYHAPSDDAIRIDIPAMWKRSQLVLALVRDLANAEQIMPAAGI